VTDLRAPFPWFGGKSQAAGLIWSRLGDVVNYVEPFFGSGAVLLARPDGWTGSETVNDMDGYVCNFWRALQADPDGVAHHADWPVNEDDQHARHLWLVRQRDELNGHLAGDPDYFDVKIAGWWVWGICCWIGSGWCSGNGPWSADEAGQLVHLGSAGRGSDGLMAWMRALSDRLRYVRVCCGDWTRVCGPTPTVNLGLTGVLLDPPYSGGADRQDDLYREDSDDVAHAVRTWAITHGDDPLLRIALCGYDTEHAMPPGWTAVPWKAKGGYGSQGNGRGRANSAREVVWFSPHCLTQERPWVFALSEQADAGSDSSLGLPSAPVAEWGGSDPGG
jgi:DNA adenine methylase